MVNALTPMQYSVDIRVDEAGRVIASPDSPKPDWASPEDGLGQLHVDVDTVVISDASYIQVDKEGRVIPTPTYKEQLAQKAMEAIRVAGTYMHGGTECIVCYVDIDALPHRDDCEWAAWEKAQ